MTPLDESKLLGVLVDVKTSLGELRTKVEAAVERMSRLEGQMESKYATQEGLKRIEDKIDNLAEAQKHMATIESQRAITHRLEKSEDTITWVTRGLLTAGGTIVITALVWALKHS